MHSALAHLCWFLVRYILKDSFLCNPHSSPSCIDDFCAYDFSILDYRNLFFLFDFFFYLPIWFAFQLSIRDRFSQLAFLFVLEPLGLRTDCFSQSFSLLMSTFSLLIAFDFLFFSKSYRLPFFALQNVLLPSFYSFLLVFLVSTLYLLSPLRLHT